MQEKILQGILSSSPDAILVRDQYGKVLYKNSRFDELWNMPNELQDEKDDWKIIEYVKEQFADPMEFTKELVDIVDKAEQYQDHLYLKSGKVIERFFYPLDIDDENQGVIWTFRDISEQKKAERLVEEVKLKEKLLRQATELDKLKTDFFSSISHDLKTPLNTILGAGNLIKKLHTGNEKCPYVDQVTKYIETSKKNIYRLLRLINNLIDLNRADIGQIKLKLKKCNLINIIEESTLSVREYAAAKGIELIFDTDVEEKIGACDIEKVERVILNLLSNAIKYTDSGGRIDVNIYDQGSHILISVKDTGVGIPSDIVERIFERYVQADTGEHTGSGIGLSLVKSFVELHKGTIMVKSKEKEGSEFIIELPVNHENEIGGYEEVAMNRGQSNQQVIMEVAEIDF